MARCDALVALAEAQSRTGDAAQADANFTKAAAIARTLGDAGRLATAALRAVPMSFHGIVTASEEHQHLLEEARAALPGRDSYLQAMVTARLGLVILVDPGQGVQKRSLTLNTEAVAMARRLGDRSALGYALSARMHALSGIGSAPERLATGTELGEIADDIGDELLALHGHMWRVRGLLAQGDVDAVSEEIMRFRARESGPAHPREVSFHDYVAAMMALVAGDFETAESSARDAMKAVAGSDGEALTFFGGLMIWTWWQRDELASPESGFWEVAAQAPAAYPTVRAILALAHAESGETEAALAALRSLSELGLLTAAEDRTEGVSLAMAGAACSVIGDESSDIASRLYEEMRPYAGTAIVTRAPVTGCLGPADQYLGLLAGAMGDLALAEVHFEAALRLARRMVSAPFVAAAEVELARTLRRPRTRRGAGGRAVAQRGGVGAAYGVVACGAHGGRAGLTPGQSKGVSPSPVRSSSAAASRVSMVRSRPAMLLSSASRKPGMLAMAANSRGPMMSTSRSDSAVTVAVRGPGFERGQLAEEVARAEGVHPPALLGHCHGAGENEEELPADPPLAHKDLALADLDPLGQADHLRQLGLRALAELVDGHQPLDGCLTPVGGYHAAHPPSAVVQPLLQPTRVLVTLGLEACSTVAPLLQSRARITARDWPAGFQLAQSQYRSVAWRSPPPAMAGPSPARGSSLSRVHCSPSSGPAPRVPRRGQAVAAAWVAQSVEQRTRNAQVRSSNLLSGSSSEAVLAS